MKNFTLITILFLFLVSCGPSKDEQERQRQIEDSIHSAELENVLDDVNNYFELDSLSTEKNEIE